MKKLIIFLSLILALSGCSNSGDVANDTPDTSADNRVEENLDNETEDINITLDSMSQTGFDQSSITPQDYLNSLTATLSYDTDTGKLSFTIPEMIPEGWNLYLQLSGRTNIAGGSSWHAFEEESEQGNWIAGQTYETEIDPSILEGIEFFAELSNEDGEIYEGVAEIYPPGEVFVTPAA